MHVGEPHGKNYFAVTRVYVGQPLVVAASRNRALLNGVAAYKD